MDKHEYHIEGRITPAVFRSFSIYDVLVRRRRWKGPALFALIMCAFAAACFAMRSIRQGAVMLGTVLLTIGLVLPIWYILAFFLSIRAQSKQLKLSTAPLAYTLDLTDAGMTVTVRENHVDYTWDSIYLAVRLKACTALYVSDNQAYLLPDPGEGSGPMWAFICTHVPEARRKDRRGSNT